MSNEKTAVVIDFKAAKRAAAKRREQPSPARRQVVVGSGRSLSPTQRQRRDEVRLAAKARL